MAQPIQKLNAPYAEVALGLSIKDKGDDAMLRTSAPVGPNLQDSGGMSKPSVNTQPFNNSRLEQQNVGQNISTAVPGAQSAAIGQVRVQNAQVSQAEQQAHQFKNSRVAEYLYANDGGTATFALSLPEVADQVHANVAKQKQIATTMGNPAASNSFQA